MGRRISTKHASYLRAAIYTGRLHAYEPGWNERTLRQYYAGGPAFAVEAIVRSWQRKYHERQARRS